MAGLLSFLAGGARAGIAADTGRLQGEEVRRQREARTLLDQLKAQQEGEEHALRMQTGQATIKNLTDLIRERNAPPEESFGNPFEAMQGGNRVFVERGNRGTMRTLEGYTPPPASTTQPTGPTRGTKEYEDMLRREAAARASGGGGERGAQLPAPAIEKMIELDDLIGQSSRASKSLGSAVAGGKNVTGRALGVVPVPNWVRNFVGQGGEEGTGVRAELANISSSIFKMRSGAAVTPQEFSRLEPFLANDDDDESIAMIKLRKLREALADIKRIRLENYSKYGKLGASTPETVNNDDGETVTTSTGRTFRVVTP